MAKFELELPTELLSVFSTLEQNENKMLKEMTKAGAKVVLKNIKANVPSSFHGSNIMKCLKVTRSYETPSDDGINTKVAFYGYFINEQGRRVPAPLVCNVFEYGRSDFNKRPFLRKSFKANEIEKAMLEVQKKYIKEG
jgi:hypothetical protein